MSDIKDLIQKAKPAPPSKFIVMGDPMTGKTTLASKAPKPLFISTDGNAAKAGLDAVNAEDIGTVKKVMDYFDSSDEYETLVIDTIEGIADLFEQQVIGKFNETAPAPVTALGDVPYGKLTHQYKRRLAGFSESLAAMKKNVIVLTYTKRQIDDATDSITLSSELKDIRLFTKFSDGWILTSYDGENFRAHVTNKRTVVKGDVDLGPIEPFLRAAGWDMPRKKVKVGSAKK